MKKTMKIIGGALVAVAMCQQTKANPTPLTDTLDNTSGTITATITVTSTVSGPVAGEYTYSYALTGNLGNQSAVDIASFSVEFPTATAMVTDVIGGTASPPNSVQSFDVNWLYKPEVNLAGSITTVSFESPYPPQTGFASAQDNGTYGGAAGAFQTDDVYIPAFPTPPPVPDGGTTISMLGMLLVGFGALRAKFGSKRQ